jgi:hypothetical protein
MQEENTSQRVLEDLVHSRENFLQTFALIDLFAAIYEPITRLTFLPIEQKATRVPEVTEGIITQFYGYYSENRACFLQHKKV